MKCNSEASGGFVEPEDDFAEDDIFTPNDELSLNGDLTQSFLERDNFEKELGNFSDDPFAEDFSDMAQYDIVNVIGDGDRAGRPIILIFAYRLPLNKLFDNQKFLRFLQFNLDKVVELDYTIVYCHYGLRSNNKPPLTWLGQAYSILHRKYKKNLKSLFVVHPTKFIKVLWRIFKPFISMKFEQKLHYVNYLHELSMYLRVEQLNLPQPIKDHDSTLLSSSLSIASNTSFPVSAPRPTQQFNVSLSFILSHHPDYDLPPLVVDLISFLRENSLEVEGLFRRSADVASIRRLQDRVDRGEKIDFLNEEPYKDNLVCASIDASVLLKTFLRSLGEPLTTNDLYPKLAALTDLPKRSKLEAICKFVTLLPQENLLLLKTICHFLGEVAAHSKNNLMNANNLCVVFGPNLTWPTNQQAFVSQSGSISGVTDRLVLELNSTR